MRHQYQHYFYNKRQQQHRHQYHYQRYQQQQHQLYCLAKIPKMQQQSQIPAYQMLRFLLLLVCYCCYSHASMEYSAKLSNCYDNQYGFNDHYVYNSTATVTVANAIAKNFTNNSTIINSITLTNNNNNDNSSNNSSQLMPQQIHLDGNVARRAEMDSLNSRRFQQSPVSGWKCCCWNATNLGEIECRCEGEALTRVPQTLTIPLQRLTIASAGLPRLRNTGLKVYNASLLDIVLTDLKYLETIQDGAFASLKLLRTIYISHAPKRIINSGLTKIPDLIHLPTTNILQMIDLDNNHITEIESKSINIKTDQ
ncbi:hypothetical protein DOY81_009129, partial [Sarcophaga bullata]